MKRIHWVVGMVLLHMTGMACAAAAGPETRIKDTTTTILMDGNLSDWTDPPAVVLGRKDQVVVGAGIWKGPQTASARIRLTYDHKNLYIGAEISSMNPQFNSQRDAELYNGDCLEVYIGTDLSDPARASYALTDVQFGLSPGKKGDKPLVYSFTDKANVPGAQIATSIIPGGYTLEASIPLEFLYKLDIGPGKSIGFDAALDDTGPGGTTRAIQMVWSGSDKAWQDPSVWGRLTFEGKTAFTNTTPKVAVTAFQVKELNPEAGRRKASQNGVLLWGFNGDPGGFTGKTAFETKIATEGTGALAIDIDGSTGWNQSLAVSEEIPKSAPWDSIKAFTFELFLPPGSMAETTYAEVFVVVGSVTNSFYQAAKIKLQEGWNFAKADVDPAQFKGGVQKVYLVFNSGGPLKGTAVLDNFRGIPRGAPGRMKAQVVDSEGLPVAGALAVVANRAVSTDPQGNFEAVLDEDEYKVEVLKEGFEHLTVRVSMTGGKDTVRTFRLTPFRTVTQAATVKAEFDHPLRVFNPHYMYGNNIAPWYETEWFPDTAIPRIRDIFDFIRVPGGGYSVLWRWKSGDILRKDGTTVDWAPPLKWDHMADFIKRLGPEGEALMTLNITTADVQNALDWIADAKARGLRVKYVELGNEPDYEPDLVFQGQRNYWTVIDNYCKRYMEFAKAIRAAHPELKLMGPSVGQLGYRERKEGSPWLAAPDAPWWDGEFLKKCNPYVDVVSLHTYPYWSNDSDDNLLSKTGVWAEYLPKVRKAITEYAPGRKVEIAVTEWNSGQENAATASWVNGVFTADFMGQMLLNGVDLANIWDLYTQKPGLGGGHGVLDPKDTVRPFSERPAYWALFMFRKYFGNTLCNATTGHDLLSAYASTMGRDKYLMVVNKSKNTLFTTQVGLGAGTYQLELYSMGPKQYQWSENLYRAVVNKGPSYQKANKPVERSFKYSFQPYTITCFKLVPMGVAK